MRALNVKEMKEVSGGASRTSTISASIERAIAKGSADALKAQAASLQKALDAAQKAAGASIKAMSQ